MFPTTSILDPLNTYDLEETLNPPWEKAAPSARWGDLVGDGVGHVRASVTFESAMAYNDQADYGDQESFVQFSTVAPTSSHYGGVCLRMSQRSSVSSTCDGYRIIYLPGSGIQMQIFTNTGITLLSNLVADVAMTLANGDWIGGQVVGSTINAFVFQSGAWSLVSTATDTTYATGVPGLLSKDQTVKFVNFGGGVYVPPVPRASFDLIRV